MEKRLNEYIQNLFAGAPKTQAMAELQVEMEQNLLEKYRDLLESGMSEEEAYGAAVGSIGDISGLIGEVMPEKIPSAFEAERRQKVRSGILVAAAVMLYILSVVPVIILSMFELEIFGVVAMFAMIALATGLLIFNSMTKVKYLRSDQTMTGDFRRWRYQREHSRSGLRVLVVALTIIIIFAILAGTIIAVSLFSGGWDWLDRWISDEKLTGEYMVTRTVSIDQPVEDIDISWVNGEVLVVPSTGDRVEIIERCQRELDEREQMSYTVSGGKLKVKFHESRIGWLRRMPRKKLEIQVPAGQLELLRRLYIDAVSADVTVSVGAEEMTVHNVSGRIDIQGADAGSIRINTVSGNVQAEGTARSVNVHYVSSRIQLAGAFDEIKTDGVSGGLTVESRICPSKITSHTVSGDVKLTIPENNGFSVKFNKVSGKLNCDFPLMNNKTYKEGGADFSFDTVSGDVTIRRSGE
ncbi:MAG: DUF4097 family beta strand repeat-containing protein [Oscillospiraceae bacterium]|nr:DUF4097 family beta strand repeat-containing protein [Oscillospiraceae bacterium]